MSEIYYWEDETESYCVLVPDWKNDSDPEEGVWGFFVTDPLNMCPYVEQGWEYSWYSEEEGSEFGYMQVASGDMWMITDEETYYMYYYEEDDHDWYYDDDEYEYDERMTYVDE